VLLGELHQLDHPLVRRVRQDGYAETEHRSPCRWQGNEHTAAKTDRAVVWPYLLFAFAAGAALPVQFGVNAQLAHWLDSPVRAAFISFLTGTIILAAAAALVFKPLPSFSRLGHAPWWVWLGGALGAFYVSGSIVAAPRLGAAALIAVIVAGQSLASVVVDQFGWVGFEPKHVSAGRLAGMALVGAGVVLVRIF
jgi:transporter family-2 protein